MYLAQIDYKDKVILNLVDKDDFHSVRIKNLSTIFCVPKRYDKLKFLADGSQGTVCSAFDCIYEQMVAIKKIPNPFNDNEHAKRAYRELKLLKMVNHKNIIKLLDAFTSSPNYNLELSIKQSSNDSSQESYEQSFNQQSFNQQSFTSTLSSIDKQSGDLYLVMELADNTLNNLIHNKMDHNRISYLIYQIFCSINYLHNLQLLHRDIKPSNIGIKNDLTIKLLDFGLARKVEGTMTPSIQTLYYRSPEMLLGFESYSNVVDVWSVGCIMGEMITNKILFPGKDTLDQLGKIINLVGSPDDEFFDKLGFSTRDLIKKRFKPCKGENFEKKIPDSAFIRNDNESFNEHHELCNKARDLLAKILVINPEERITIDEALRHPYINVWLEKDNLRNKRMKLNEFIEINESIDDWKELIYFYGELGQFFY